MPWCNYRARRGNLEGFVLGHCLTYQSTDYAGATIHSGMAGDIKSTMKGGKTARSNPRVYVAVYQVSEDQPNWVVAGLQEEQVKKALDRLRAVATDKPFTPREWSTCRRGARSDSHSPR